MELLNTINPNVLGGVIFAVFAVLVGTRLSTTGIRDYILIMTIAILGTASVIERWFLTSSIVTSCLVGFAIGFLADDVYLNLKATIPDFVKDILDDLFKGIKDKVRKMIGSE